jgi:hypothetical protein
VRAELGFDAVALGRPLAVSDLIATAAAVAEVVAVNVTAFGYAAAAGFTAAELQARGVEYTSGASVAPVQPRLRFFPARPGPTVGSVTAAELPTVRAASDIVVTDGGRA